MEQENGKAALYRKMSNVMHGLSRLPKRGRNTHFGYDYVLDCDVLDAVREAMAEQGLALLVEMIDPERDGKIITVTLKLTFADGETGATHTVRWRAEAMDGQDKGLAKAATSGVKYALLKTFLIATGDEAGDPDGGAGVSAKAGVPVGEKPAREATNGNQAGGNVVNEPTSVFWHLYNTQGKAAGIPVEQARALVAGGDWRTAIGKLRELIGSGAAQRPYAPGQLADCLARKIDAKPASQRNAPATEKQVPFIAQKLEECFAGEDNAADKRHAVLGWLVGKKSAKALTKAEASAILDWLLDPDADPGTYDLHPAASQEARAVHRQVLKEAGQAEMEM